ncbi:S8 family serine peptidase [Planosporangium thailandense]|uniref:S8 family serine peptidase n=1 Tax=Planosporangium thailandense TaxID=765197 RepID=UPI0030B7F97A
MRTSWAGSAALTVAVLAAALAGSGVAAAAPADGTVRHANAADAVRNSYIVVLKAGDATPGTVVAAAGRLAHAYGGSVRHTYTSSVKGFSVRMSEQAAKRLAADPAVSYVEQDRKVRITGTQTNPPSWGLDRIDQPSLPLNQSYTYPNTAAAVHAYILDTGIRITHREFGGRASYGHDFIDNDAVASDDDCSDGTAGTGHGTHVAGIVGGSTSGVAKAVQLVAVRVLDCHGVGDYSQIIAGVDWVTSNAVKPAVANMSLGGPADDTLDAAVKASITSGITYTVAAGNSGVDAAYSSPADVPEAITVGATDESDTRAWFSNYGTCVDLFAPGVDITSASNADNTSYVSKDGTSMASPYVAGAAAMYLAANPSATPTQVQAALLNAATPGKVRDAGPGSPDRLLNVAIAGRPAAGTVPQPTGADSSRVKADFNGDGRDDLALFYDYGNGRVALWTLTAQAGGGFGAPVLRWQGPNWGPGTKFVTAGDFNGDGKADLALFYDYGNGHVTLWTLTADRNGDGGFSGPLPRWDRPVWGTRTKFVTTGDFNGDGRDDLALFYDYGNGRVALWTLTAAGSGTGNLGGLANRWTAPYWGTGTKFLATGDFNGDRRSDIALFYDYGTSHVAVFTLTATGTGTLAGLANRWTAPYWGTGTKFLATGDFNGDGKTDISLFYDYGTSHVALFTLTATGTGTLGALTNRWNAPYWGTGTKFLATGDFNGDGKTDISLFYDYGTSHVAVFTLTATGSGTLGGLTTRWNAPHWGSGTRAMR